MSAAIRSAALLSVVLTFVVAGCKKDTEEMSASGSGAKPSYFSEDRQKATATVEAIDQDTREITIKNEEGEVTTLTAGPEVQNFAQIKPGDRIEAEYYESIAINVRDAKNAADISNSVEQAAARTAPLGDKPAGVGARQVTLVANVEKIDAKSQLVTLRGKSGNTRVVKVRDPKNLQNLKVGDQVVATYTEALAVAVKPVK
jgi:Cu/Ag efflux protein CusF